MMKMIIMKRMMMTMKKKMMIKMVMKRIKFVDQYMKSKITEILIWKVMLFNLITIIIFVIKSINSIT